MDAKDSYEAKYQYLIKQREEVGLQHLEDPKVSIKYSNYINDIYKSIEHYNLRKESPDSG